MQRLLRMRGNVVGEQPARGDGAVDVPAAGAGTDAGAAGTDANSRAGAWAAGTGPDGVGKNEKADSPPHRRDAEKAKAFGLRYCSDWASASAAASGPAACCSARMRLASSTRDFG